MWKKWTLVGLCPWRMTAAETETWRLPGSSSAWRMEKPDSQWACRANKNQSSPNLRDHRCVFVFQAPNLEARELWKGFLYSVIDVNINLFLNSIISYFQMSNNYCLFLLITAERPYEPHVVAGPATNVKGGGGQREDQAENPQPCTSASFTPLGSFSGGDSCVSGTILPHTSI